MLRNLGVKGRLWNSGASSLSASRTPPGITGYVGW